MASMDPFKTKFDDSTESSFKKKVTIKNGPVSVQTLSVGTSLPHINSRTQKSVRKKIGSGTCKRISVNSPCWETSDSCMDKSWENGSCSLEEGMNSQTQPPANVQIT